MIGCSKCGSFIYSFLMSYHTEAEEHCQSYEMPALRALMALNGP